MTSVSQQIRDLQSQAKALADGQVRAMLQAMHDLEVIAQEIEGGGDAYAVGVREVARQLAEEMEARAQGLGAILARA